MKKRLLTIFLAIAIICTLIVGSASAASVYRTIGGKACTGSVSYNSTFTMVTASSSFPDAIASEMIAKAYYSFTIDGIADTVTSKGRPAYDVTGTIYEYASRPSSLATASSATSRHTFSYNGTTININPGNIYP